MDVAIALPNAVPGATGVQLVEWARRAEARGFSSLGTIDRVVYENYEPLTALAAAAAVTERIGLCTSVLLGPLRANATELAKQALSVHALSGGRLTLGVGLGAREDDYEASGIELTGRGRRLDAMLARIKEVWSEGEVGPSIAGTPGLVVGGHADAAFVRATRFADGWIAAAGPPELFAGEVEKMRAAWREAGRKDEPRTMALAYFSLGERAAEDARANLAEDYYAWLGEDVAAYIAAGAAQDTETVRRYVSGFEDAGCDELIFCPASADPEQVDLLADAVGR
jgi:alkanesulfonate monooxygenase SsuD/methylene tetrahydromethanopterin reductase-like flavin-dependent oxidoreductase (luciferase family)